MNLCNSRISKKIKCSRKLSVIQYICSSFIPNKFLLVSVLLFSLSGFPSTLCWPQRVNTERVYLTTQRAFHNEARYLYLYSTQFMEDKKARKGSKVVKGFKAKESRGIWSWMTVTTDWNGFVKSLLPPANVIAMCAWVDKNYVKFYQFCPLGMTSRWTIKTYSHGLFRLLGALYRCISRSTGQCQHLFVNVAYIVYPAVWQDKWDNCIVPSCVSGRGYKIGPVCPSVCVSVS